MSINKNDRILFFSTFILILLFIFLENEYIINILSFIFGFIIITTVREVIISYVAYKNGDTHLKNSKTMSLNPINHINLYNMAFTTFLIIIRSPIIIGLENGVSINYYSFKNTRKSILYVGLAGFFASILLMTVSILALKIIFNSSLNGGILYHVMHKLILLFNYILNISISYFIFNFIPLPRNDMFYVVFSYADDSLRKILFDMQKFSIIIIIFFIAFIREINLIYQIKNLVSGLLFT